MRKSKVIILLCVIMIMMITSCGCFGSRIDEDDAAEQLANQIFECLNNKDVEGLKGLFSKDIVDSYNLDKQMEGIFDFFDGKIVSYEEFDAGFTREKVDYGRQTYLTIAPVIKEVKTDTENVYEISFFAYIVCEEDEDKVGIIRIRIRKNDETEYLIGDW